MSHHFWVNPGDKTFWESGNDHASPASATHRFQTNTRFQAVSAGLRKATIDYLRQGESWIAQNVKEIDSHEIQRSVVVDEGTQEERTIYFDDVVQTAEFLEHQSKSKVHATEIEAIALAELLGVPVTIKDFHYPQNEQGNTPEKTLRGEYVYNDNDIESPFMLHLDCTSNAHWEYKGFSLNGVEYPYEGVTLGDGDCLYHSGTLFVGHVLDMSASETLSSEDKEALALQDQRHQELMRMTLELSPESLKETLESIKAEALRLEDLDPEEKQAIDEDYQYALEVAKEEMKSPSF